MADFEYKDYSSNDWGHSQDDHSDKELSKYIGDGSEKKLSKEEKELAKKKLKDEKIQQQKDRRQKRLAELLAMEEAEKKNDPQNKTKQTTDKKLVPEDKKKEQTPEDQKLENVEGETPDTKNTPSSSNSEQPQQEIIPKAEVKAKKEGEKEKGKEAEDSEKKKQEEKPEDSKDKLEATTQEGLEQAGQRLTDLVDPSKDGGIERVENTLTETKDQASTELFQNSEEKLQGKKNSILFLKNNEQHKESASVKRKKSEQAVNEKPTEKQAEVQNKKVKEVATTKEPLLEKDASQTLLRQKMEKAMPTTMEQVDEFKENKDLGEVNEMVKGKITQETVKVQKTYQTIENPEKADNPKTGTPLPQKVEPALPTNELGLGKDLLTPIADETLDTSQFTEEAQNLLDKEGITKEQLAEVKSGDLLEAKKELDIIDNTAKAEPSKIKKAEKQEHASINREIKSKEQTEKDKMRKEREAGLRNAQSTQKGTKESLEKKKEEVSKTINGIYERVNKSVLDRLARLEKDIIRKFDAVQAKAMQDFEKNVNKKIEAYKKERYGNNWFSWKKLKDWWTGIDKHPRVIQIFEEETKIFIGTIDRAINDLMAESKRVIDGCKQEVAKAKEEIAEYVKSLPLALQATGKEAQEKINKQLEELDKKIDKVAKELEATLQEKRKKAIEALNEKIEKMKENLGSALSKAGKFLLDAAFKFFKAVLEGMGYSMDDIMPYINKGKKILTSIVTEPGNFFSNLGKGVGGGISNFTTNIGTHLQTGIFDWLTGSMGGTGIQLPIAWDLGGVIFFVSQLLGVGWEQIKMKLGAQVGQENMAHLETAIAQGEEGMETVKKVQKEGVSGAMEVVQDQATEIKETAVSEVKNWAITAIIQAAIPKILSMFNPAGAIVQAILAIYKAVTWFVMNFERIIQWAKAVFDSIAHIASGAIGEATKKVEETMGRSLGLVITFLASQIGLGKVGDAIKKVIQKVRQPIEKVVDKVVKWIANKVKKLMKKVRNVFGKKDKKHNPKDDKDMHNNRLMHQKYVDEILESMSEGSKANSMEGVYQEKRMLAQKLERQYNKLLGKNLKTTVTLESFEKAKKDGMMRVTAKIAPNDAIKHKEVSLENNKEDLLLTINEFFTDGEHKKYTIQFKAKSKGGKKETEQDQTIVLVDLQMNLDEYLNHLKTYAQNNNADAKVIQEIDKAIRLSGEIETIKTEQNLETRKNITKKLEILAKRIEKVFNLLNINVTYPTKREVAYGSEDGVPKFGFAQYLHKDTVGGGQAPSQDPKGWGAIEYAGLVSTWVRMHLILERVGGEGTKRNLVPGTKDANSGLEGFPVHEWVLRYFTGKDEAKAKKHGTTVGDAISAKGVYDMPAVLWLKVEVVEWHQDKVQQYQGGPYDHDATTFPKMIHGRAGFHRFNNKTDKWEMDTKAAIESSISVAFPKFDDAADIHLLSEDNLIRKINISKNTAQKIRGKTKKHEKFDDMDDLELYLSGEGIAQAEIELIRQAKNNNTIKIG